MRSGAPLVEQALSRQSRYGTIRDNRRVKEVRLDSAAELPIKAEARDVIGRALAIARGPHSDPLVQVWELRQMWLGYEAAAGILEEALCPLVVELRTTHSLEDLALAAGEPDVPALELRVHRARHQRRGPDGQPVTWPQAH